MRLLAICLIGLVCAQINASTAQTAICGISYGELDEQLPNYTARIKIIKEKDAAAGCIATRVKVKCDEMSEEVDGTFDLDTIMLRNLSPKRYTNCLLRLLDSSMVQVSTPTTWTFTIIEPIEVISSEPSRIVFIVNKHPHTRFTEFTYTINDEETHLPIDFTRPITIDAPKACMKKKVTIYGAKSGAEPEEIAVRNLHTATATPKVESDDSQGSYRKELTVTIENPGDCEAHSGEMSCNYHGVILSSELNFVNNQAIGEFTDLGENTEYNNCTLDVEFNDDFKIENFPFFFKTLPAIRFEPLDLSSANFVFLYDGIKSFNYFEYRVNQGIKWVRLTPGANNTLTNLQTCSDYKIIVAGKSGSTTMSVASGIARTHGAKHAVITEKVGSFVHELKVEIINPGNCRIADAPSITCNNGALHKVLEFDEKYDARVVFEDVRPHTNYSCTFNMSYVDGYVMPEFQPYEFETNRGINAITETPSSVEFYFKYDGTSKYDYFTYLFNDASEPVKLALDTPVVINDLKTCKLNKIVIHGVKEDTGENVQLDVAEIRTMASAPIFLDEKVGAFLFEATISIEHITECNVREASLRCAEAWLAVVHFEDEKSAHIKVDTLKPLMRYACPFNVVYGEGVTPPKEQMYKEISTNNAVTLSTTKPGEINVIWNYDGDTELIHYLNVTIIDGKSELIANFSDGSAVIGNRVHCRSYEFEVYSVNMFNKKVFFGKQQINAMSAAPPKPDKVETTVFYTDVTFNVESNRINYDCTISQMKIDCGSITEWFDLPDDGQMSDYEVEMKDLNPDTCYNCKVAIVNEMKQESKPFVVAFRTNGMVTCN